MKLKSQCLQHARIGLLFAVAVCASVLSMPIRAQSLSELFENARNFDATYLAARAQYEANLARANQALGGILPNIALQASNTRSKLDIQATNPIYQSSIPGPVPRFYNVAQGSVILTQALYRPALWEAYKQSDAQTQLAAIDYTVAEQDLILRVSQAYFDLLNAQDSLRLYQQQQTAVSEQLASAKRNFEVGTTNITGVRDAQARYDLSAAQAIAAANDVQIKQLALDTLTGLQHTNPKPLQELRPLLAAPQEDMSSWIAAAQSNSLTIQKAQLNLTMARLESSKAMSAHLPTVDAQIAISDIHNEGGSNMFGFGTNIVNPSAAVVLNVPIFSGFATQNRVRETIALEQKASADLDAATRNTELQTRTAYYNVITGLAQVKAYEAAAASSQSSLQANQLGYTVGVNINMDVLNAQSQFYQTQRDLAKSRYETLIAKLHLMQAVGTLSAQDLDAINQLLLP